MDRISDRHSGKSGESDRMQGALRIAAFGGFRSIPPGAGGAGADKFALELYTRLVKKGHDVTAYCRNYANDIENLPKEYKGIKLKWLKTVNLDGFDTLCHSMKSTVNILFGSGVDVVHIQSGANSIWSAILRMSGKYVCLSQFAMDWKREKWPWYGKIFYRISNYITAYFPNSVVFDNVFSKSFFEHKFKRNYDFIPYGCEVDEPECGDEVLAETGVEDGKYFLFIGRFIPDKGIHLLVEAFEHLKTDFKLLIVGGPVHPNEYEAGLHETKDDRIIFPGYIYGEKANYLIGHAYAYVQPSLIEGLSPVILTVMGLGTPVICSDLQENIYITGDNALLFACGDAGSLKDKMEYALREKNVIKMKAAAGMVDIRERFCWDTITDQYLKVFKRKND